MGLTALVAGLVGRDSCLATIVRSDDLVDGARMATTRMVAIASL